MNLSSLLNSVQQQAVEYNEGPSIIVAGAGSGKTRVLTYKIAYMLENGVSPSNILALTFTNKAAREMKERIAAVVGERPTKYLWMGTFHSIFLRILRYESDAVGFQPNFTVYDTADSKSLIKSIVKDLGLDNKVYNPKSMISRISTLKNHMVSPMAYADSRDSLIADKRAQVPDFAQVYQAYCRRCREANAMDFDDILVYMNALIAQREDILEKYQDRFQYILVDEYQDTNTIQHSIVTRLAAKHARISVVGDDAQSIYSFRGAQIDNMLRFNESFCNCKIFKLEENYRSTQNIVKAANSLISKNINQIKKNVFSNRGTGERIDVIRAYSDYDEAAQVATRIVDNINNRLFDYRDIAILYRTNAQSRVLEEALRRVAIPYKIYGGLSFYQRKEIKDVLAYLRLIINPDDIEALKRVINYPTRGIGDTTLQKLLMFQRDSALSMFNILADPISCGLPVNKGTTTKLMNFADLIERMREVHRNSDAFETVEQVLSISGVMADLNSTADPDNETRKENVSEFLAAVKEYCDKALVEGNDYPSLEDFLSEVSLLTDMDNEEGDKLNSVTLMTVHASKGLEFGMVYIVGVEENLFPSQRVEDLRDLEEERRLFYVAVTRAKECCTVSYAESRFVHGQTQFSEKSRFLTDIDPEYINLPRPKSSQFGEQYQRKVVDPFGMGATKSPNIDRAHNYGAKRYSSNTNTANRQEEPVASRSLKRVSNYASDAPLSADKMLSEGQRVAHQLFGEGVVTALEGRGENTKATIKFDSHGDKQLLLKYARLTTLK